jgi:hypothetical protein
VVIARHVVDRARLTKARTTVAGQRRDLTGLRSRSDRQNITERGGFTTNHDP